MEGENMGIGEQYEFERAGRIEPESGRELSSIADLAMLVRRLVQQITKHEPENDVAEKAMEYLQRKDLIGSIVRETTSSASGEGLEYITSEELFNELARRNDCTVLLALTSRTDQEDLVLTEWRGRPTTALGLLARAEHRMLRHLAEDEEEEGG